MGIVKRLNNEFNPYSKEQSLYRVKKENPRKDPKAIKEFKEENPKCIICGEKADAHHRKTKGAGGANHKNNLLPLCRKHHIERHTIGAKTFKEKHKLEIENWERRK